MRASTRELWFATGGCAAWPRRAAHHDHRPPRGSTSTCSTGRPVSLRSRSTRSPRSQLEVFSPGKVETMISSTRSSWTAWAAAVNGSGCATWPCASMPSPRRIVSARRRRRSASGCSRGVVALRRDDQERDGPLRAPARGSSRAAARRRPSRSRPRARSPRRRPLLGSRSTTTCSTGRPPAASSIRSTTFWRSQPERCCGWVETTISSAAARAGDRVAGRGDRVGLDDEARGRDPGRAQRLERPLEPAAGRGAARVLVDDVALARLVDRRDHGHAHGPSLRRRSIASIRLRPATVSLAITSTCRSLAHACTSSPSVHAVAVEDGVPRARDAVLVRVADDLRDLVEVEDRRRRAHLPLERQRAPRVRGRRAPEAPARDHVVEEDDRRGAEPERRDRDEQVQVGEARRVVGDAARHPLDPEPVHREEGQVEADERQPEVQLAERLVVHPAGHLREPEVDPGEDREQRAAEEHVVDVRDDEVRVRGVDVDRHGGEVDPGEAADHEHRDEAEREQHRRLEVDPPLPKRREPGEDLDPGRDGDHHRRDHHRHAQPGRHPGHEHVVRPDREAEHEDRHQRERHQPVAEDRLPRHHGDHLRGDAEAGQHHDVDGRVRVEPEDVLVPERVAARGRVEEVRVHHPVEHARRTASRR